MLPEQHRELDALVAVEVMGFLALSEEESIKLWQRDVKFYPHIVWSTHSWQGYWRLWVSSDTDARPWMPSTDVGNAWEVSDRIAEIGWRGINILIDEMSEPRCQVSFSTRKSILAGIGRVSARSDTMPEAVCLAALEVIRRDRGNNAFQDSLKSLLRWNWNRK